VAQAVLLDVASGLSLPVSGWSGLICKGKGNNKGNGKIFNAEGAEKERRGRGVKQKG
jgi:hypothetical protein